MLARSDPPQPAPGPGAMSYATLITLIAALGGLLFGFDTGVISGALLFIIPEFHLGAAAQGVVVGIVTLGALAGALLGGAAADAVGRRPTNIAGGATFIIGSLVSAAAPDVASLIVGRFVIGVAIGLSSVAAPLYIAELAPAGRRGTLVSLFQLAVTIGILASYVIDRMLAPTRAWRTICCAPQVVEAAGFGSATTALAATIGIGVVNVLATVVAIALVDHWGRRPLLLAGLTGMIVSLLALGLASHEGTTAGWLGATTVACIGMYIVCFAFSLGPIVWLMIAEIYPNRIRARAASVSTAANWSANFLVSLTFPLLRAGLGSSLTFTLYALLGVIGIAFVALRVPETRGKSLEESAAGWRTWE